MTLVLGIDPGKATGMALYDTDTCKVVWTHEAQHGVYGFRGDFNELLYQETTLDCDVACEGFTLRSSNKFTANLQGVEIIGWLKGEEHCADFPEPSQHMSLVKKPVLTKMMKEAGFKVGAGHTRMALSVAVWYAAKVLKHRPTLEMLSNKESK